MKKIIILGIFALIQSCATQKIEPTIITEKVTYDTDDPAIWINPKDASKSLIIGTDKDSNGSLYVFDLDGKIVNKVSGLARPNNVDIEYGLTYNGKRIDFAAVTERETNKVRLFELPSMKEIGSFAVFEGEKDRSPMGIAIYKNSNNGIIDIIVGRKSGPKSNYLWQYRLVNTNNQLGAQLIRKFGNYSGLKEIESIVVDNELGYVYYSDEKYGVRKYHANPSKGNNELLVFGKNDFARDIEGISIYKKNDTNGYILVSNQQADVFNVYKREAPEEGLLTKIRLSTLESDGSEVTSINLGPKYPNGAFVAMSNGKVFHVYDWRLLQSQIDQSSKK